MPGDTSRGQVAILISHPVTAVDPPPPPPPPPPPGNWQALPTARLNEAIAEDLMWDREVSWGTNAVDFGQPCVALAYAAFRGDTAADARLRAQIAFTLQPGNMTLACGGVHAQYECRTAAMFCIVRRTPRIWDGLTTTQRDQINALMKGILIDAAWMGSDTHPTPTISGSGSGTTLRGVRRTDKSVGPNFANAIPVRLMIAGAFFGAAQAASILQNYSHSAFQSELTALFGTGGNMTRTFRWAALGSSGVPRSGSPSAAPSGALIQSTIWPFRYLGAAIDNIPGLMSAQHSLSKMLDRRVISGLNPNSAFIGQGAAADPSRGKIVQNASGTPHLGVANSMFREYDGQDDSGERSSAGYVTWGLRNWTDCFLALEVAAAWDRSNATISGLLQRFGRAMEVHRYFTQQGYHSWAHGGTNGGGGGSPRTWTYAAAAAGGWQLPLTESLWFDILAPRFGL